LVYSLEMTAIHIRRIQKEDNSELASLVRNVLREFNAPEEGTALQDDSLDSMFETYSLPGAAYFVAISDEQIIGGCGFAPLDGGDADICELQKMYLVKEARGQGTGRTLLKHCLDYARESGYRACYLETLPDMQRAHSLYLNAGFRILPQRIGSTGHFSCDIWMYKEL